MSKACDIVVEEAFGPAGLLSLLRDGNEPGDARMSKLLQALAEVQEQCSDAPQLEKELAGAMYALATHGAAQLESWEAAGGTIAVLDG